ncbi:MAG: hypothetical protein V1644_02405 [Candidatus Micrarchaeota archaeon]
MKAQLEMWILTKIAMLFFIIALALIALNISNMEKSALCGEQALATANVIASNINQVLASPVEDARVVYKFEPTIPVSKDKYGERYEVWLSEHVIAGQNKVQLSVIVNPLSDLNCKRRVSLFYDDDKVDTFFYSSTFQIVPDETISPQEKIVKLEPSLKNVLERTKFLVIIKCKEKKLHGISMIYFDNCKNDQSNQCSPFDPFSPYAECG